MDDDSRVIDKGWDGLPAYASKSGDADDAVTVSISTTPGEWLVNTNDAVVVPMSMAELVEGLRNHTLNERSLVWRAGMQEWAPIERVPQLKLAARMPLAVVAPAPATVAPRPSGHRRPPPKPVRHSPHGVQPQIIPSRKSTLPFGLPTPAAGTPRASQAKPSSAPRATSAAPASNEDSEVLAVYARPAATISFDLAPEQPLRVAGAPASVPPETLAPMTTDSAKHRVFTPRNPDLSVVAASQFREVQRSSKRWIWISSLASAAAASLFTFWVARGPATAEPVAAASVSEALAAPPAPKRVAAASAALVAEAPAAPSVSSPTPAAAPATPAVKASVIVALRPRAPRRTRAASAAAVAPATPDVSTDDAPPVTREPSAEPNPYDVKLDDEPAPAAKALAPPASVEASVKNTEATGSGSSSPGF